MKIKKFIFDNLTTLFYAFIIAIFIRSLIIQPFYIPSSSMEPSLLIGDRLFVSKYSYGYSRHSIPFSPNFTNKRYLNKAPSQGDVIVFKVCETRCFPIYHKSKISRTRINKGK